MIGRPSMSVFALAVLVATASGADDSFADVAGPFLKQHCVGCHGEKRQEGGVRLDRVTGVEAGHRTLSTLVHQKVSSGEMPPADKPRADAAEKDKLLKWVAAKQRALGVSGTRRLNRRELAASLRDVTGLDIDFAAALPGDGTVAGFDTGADALQEASDRVEQWLVVTRRAVDGLRFLDPPLGKTFAIDFREVKDIRKAFEAWKADGLSGKELKGTPQRLGLLIETRAVGDREELSFSVPAPPSKEGVLRLTLNVSAMKPFANLPAPRLWVRIGGRDLDFREVTPTADKPQRLVYEVQLGDLVVQAKGVTISLASKVEIPYAVEGFENEDKTSANDKNPPPGGTGPFRPFFDRKLPPETQPSPFVVLHDITIEPGASTAWPPASWGAKVGDLKDDVDSAKRLLALWADRTWRRPSSEAEHEPFLKLYTKLRGEGLGFDAAVPGTITNSVLMDQVAAKHLGPTWVPSLALSFADGVGTSTLSRNAMGVDVPATANFRTVFERLFPPADKGQLKQAAARIALDKSVLDTATGSVKDFQRQLGADDRRRLDQYLESIREVEKRLDDSKEILESGRPKFDEGAVKTVPQSKNGMREHIELMTDLIALAFQTDMTRVVTHSLGGEGGPNYDEYKDWAQKAGAPVRGAHDVHHKAAARPTRRTQRCSPPVTRCWCRASPGWSRS